MMARNLYQALKISMLLGFLITHTSLWAEDQEDIIEDPDAPQVELETFQEQPSIEDGSHTLSKEFKQAIEALIIEQEQSSGELIQIIIKDHALSGDQSRIEETVRKAFESHRVGGPYRDNQGILIYIDPKNSQMGMERGIGLEATLDEDFLSDLIKDEVHPLLKQHHVEYALTLTLVTLLKKLESPLVASGKLGEFLKSWKLEQYSEPQSQSGKWVRISGALGIVFLLLAIFVMVNKNLVFSSQGSYRINPIFDLLLQMKSLSKNSKVKIQLGGTDGNWS